MSASRSFAPFALWEGWFGYDRKKYTALLREAFELFVQCLPKALEIVLLDDSLTEEQLKRFTLFASLRCTCMLIRISQMQGVA